MRQAGRYLPEYMDIRKSVNSFLDLCYDPEKVSKVTLQPINRFGFDYAIIFSDILVLPNCLGWNIKFENGIGPILNKFESDKDLAYFHKEYDAKIQNVYDAISNVKSKLPSDIPLIGFAGSPWTVCVYLFEGSMIDKNFISSKKMIYQNRNTAKKLIDFITQNTILHLKAQIKAGADIIQLFDSWSGLLSEKDYDDFVINPTKQIVSKLKKDFPHIPIIGFPKGSGFLYERYIKKTCIDIISVDQFIPLAKMKNWSKKLIVQGNLDPIVLLTDQTTIEGKVKKILSTIPKDNYIFNLGHGILPSTPIKNVEFLVKYVKDFG